MAQSLKEQISAVFSCKDRPADRLHRRTSEFVCAERQARIAEAIEELMSEEEQTVYRRGGNANPAHHAKNASLADYMKATALETLCGYLYLQGNIERVIELIHEGIVRTEPKKPGPRR